VQVVGGWRLPKRGRRATSGWRADARLSAKVRVRGGESLYRSLGRATARYFGNAGYKIQAQSGASLHLQRGFPRGDPRPASSTRELTSSLQIEFAFDGRNQRVTISLDGRVATKGERLSNIEVLDVEFRGYLAALKNTVARHAE
jgi:hypothetical protein